MSSCCADKTEVPLPKEVKDDTGNTGFRISEKYRAQFYKTKDEVHIHDDEAGLCFVYKGKRSFQLGVDMFIRNQHQVPENATCLIKGETISKTKQAAADVVLCRDGYRWNISLVPAGSAVAKVLICDRVISALDDFAQQIQ